MLHGTPIAPFALAVLASVLLGPDQPAEALQVAEEAMSQLRELGSIEEGESLLRLVYAEALDRLGDARASAAIAEANDSLMTRAAAIADPVRRSTFLERVDENSRTLALAQK